MKIPVVQIFVLILAVLLVVQLVSAQQQVPVLMVHGLYGDSINFAAMKLRLIRAGYSMNSVYAIDLVPDDTVCDPGHVAQISTTVGNIITETGSSQIDVIGHSDGGLDLLNYMLFDTGVEYVRNFIALGSPLLTHCWVSFGKYPDDMTPGDNTRYTSIYSLTDEVVPSQLSYLEGANNIELSGVSHAELLYDKDVFALVLDTVQGVGFSNKSSAAPTMYQNIRNLPLTWGMLRR